MESASPTCTIRFTDWADLKKFISGLPATLADALTRNPDAPGFAPHQLRLLTIPLSRDLQDAAKKSRNTGACFRVFLRTVRHTKPVAVIEVQLFGKGRSRGR